jgi:hypothetical protein
VSSSFSEVGIVRVEHSLVHIAAFGNFSEEEPQERHRDDSLPQSVGYNVPHFVVEAMDFLETLQVVLL